MSFTKTLLAAVVAVSISSVAQAATIVPPTEDVMTSAFFTSGGDFVRGYAGDSRPTFRVANDGAFGVGAETIYMTFDPSAIGAISGPITATLTVQSKDGGFGANAGPGSPFTVSAHGVDTDPLTAITDNTNPGGLISSADFLANNVLAADPAAFTNVESFGAVTFDVTALVSDWISGANTVFALALTGKNHTGSDFLHGFDNNTEAPGSTFLTITNVPEPTSVVLLALASVMVLGSRRKSS